MVPRFPRRRDDAEEPADGDDDEPIHLDSDEHAWWALRTPEDLLRERRKYERPEEPPRDILAEHFGDDWRTTFHIQGGEYRPPSHEQSDLLAEEFGEDWRHSFDLQPPPDAATAPGEEPGGPTDADPAAVPPDATDPYEVLGIGDSATWEEIVDAHRGMARRHHPDRLAGGTAAEIEAGEEMIRRINAAYAELRVRRGK